MANNSFLDMPPFRTVVIAIGLAIGFLLFAYYLYIWNDWKPRAYWLKIAELAY